ncbi:tetratricopeptide repeat protein [Cytophaga aurantiaca]|uniref:tetratricopeptide repeat protein n=1 Tax=Cytophaga aurantiaca TaxID=29530 RepID=UPI00039B3DD9|nr:tetratricopeptide repeat protein [Cytophaga aurantiaca]
MKFNSLIAFIFLIIMAGCIGGKRLTEIEKADAERYYIKAWTILQNTTQNTLSRASATEALEYINKAIKLNDSESKYFRVRGTSYYHLKDYDSALSDFNKAISLDHTNGLAWMNRAILYENTARFDLAERDYLSALNYDMEKTTVYYNLGLLYDKWGKDSLSLHAYDEVIKLNPAYEGIYVNRGEKRMRCRLYEGAVSDFNSALKYDSTNKMAFNNRGLSKYYLKQYESAIPDFKKALSIGADAAFYEHFDTDLYSYNNMANCYFALGNIEEACKNWKIAIQKGYKYQKEWNEEYNIDDPNELILKYCH